VDRAGALEAASEIDADDSSTGGAGGASSVGGGITIWPGGGSGGASHLTLEAVVPILLDCL